MDDDLIKSLFLRARDQYESAVRWSFLVAVVCIAFHVITFHQFLRVENQLTAVKADMDRLATAQENLSGLNEALESLHARVTGALKQVTGLTPELAQHLQALDGSVQLLVEGRGMPGGLSESMMMVQQPLQSSPAIQGGFPLPEGLAQQIERNSNDIAEIRKLLRPFIEARIVDPAFERLNRDWQEFTVPPVRKEAEDIIAELKEGERSFPAAKDLWERVRQSVVRTSQVASELQFHPPEDPFWWSSVRGKEIGLFAIKQEAEAKLRSVIEQPAALSELNRQLEIALAQQEDLQDSLEENLEQIRENFETQRTQLATLGKPFELFTVDLSVFVSFFPLFLGFVLAAISVWPTRRLQELAWTIKHMSSKDPGEAAWGWFFSRTQFAHPTQRGAGSDERLRWRRWQEKSPWILGLLCLGWIGLAAWELVWWKKIGLVRAISFTGVAWLVVLSAQAYRLSVVQHVLNLVEDQSRISSSR